MIAIMDEKQFRKEAVEEGLAEGRAEGRAEGLAEGLTEGRFEARISILERQLARRFGSLTAAQRERLRDGTEVELELWADRVIDAPDIEAVFAP
jgi:flagellar biosynthesis/type III secretory pathway protein FliH